MGGNQNSQTFVGKDTAISYMLDSSGEKTEELGDIVNSLVQLREGLINSDPNLYSQEIEEAEQGLISMEDNLINKMGELSAKMVRMETARVHDEDYLLQLDQQISRDLDVDLSEAIMRLTRVSTAYQAAMQVGAQLLNTSLLNYL
jgi:flagellar hook-associated protein 3 FlgL